MSEKKSLNSSILMNEIQKRNQDDNDYITSLKNKKVT